MQADVLARLQTAAVDNLSMAVRQDQRSPAFQPGEWSVSRLSDKGVINPDGLWLYSGEGADAAGRRPWSLVLKIFARPQDAAPESDLWRWDREWALAQSGLLDRLPGPMKGARYYAAGDTPDGAWIWMEHIRDHRPGRWTLDEYAFAMREIGRWNAACLGQPQLAEAPWLTRQHYRSWLVWLDVEKAWEAPLNRHVTSDLRARYDQLWSEREVFYAAIEALPQVIGHCDVQRRNLMIRPGADQQDELVAVDWSQIGLIPLGAELNFMMGANLFTLEWPPARCQELEQAAFDAYCQGLRDAGWLGNVDQVRLAYAAYFAVYMGLIFPAFTHFWCAAENRDFALQIMGVAEETLFWQGLPMLAYALDRADEARALMRKLDAQ